jgi:hypothetical protein
MTDKEFMKIDDELFKLVIKHFDYNPADQDHINAYHGFRNDVIDLFEESEEEHGQS